MALPSIPQHVAEALDEGDLSGAIDAALMDVAALPGKRVYGAFHALIVAAEQQFGHDAVADDLLARDQSADTHAAMAILWKIAGDIPEAKKAARAALGLDPEHPIALRFTGGVAPLGVRPPPRQADRPGISVTRIVIGLVVLSVSLRLIAAGIRCTAPRTDPSIPPGSGVPGAPRDQIIQTEAGPMRAHMELDPRTGKYIMTLTPVDPERRDGDGRD